MSNHGRMVKMLKTAPEGAHLMIPDCEYSRGRTFYKLNADTWGYRGMLDTWAKASAETIADVYCEAVDEMWIL